MLPIKRTTALGDRNCPAIASGLRCQLNRDIKDLLLLEFGSKTGQHAAYLAPLFPNVIFQTTTLDPVNLSSLRAYAEDCTTNNLREPIVINVREHPTKWKTKFEPNSIDYILNVNMLHINALDAATGLFQAAGYLLKSRGKLFTYGPYGENGRISPHSSVMFDKSLKIRNASWGLRDIAMLDKLAKINGLQLTNNLNMPFNSKILTWTKIKSNCS